MLKWNDGFFADVERATGNAVKKACMVVVRSVKENFPGRGGRPSAPGEIPTVQTGTLKRSINYEIISNHEGHVGPALGYQKKGAKPANYGYWLEVGSPGGRIKPRPYLRPALDREGKKIVECFNGIL